ncbi:hypothetical protein BGZ70_010372 [Mortierella alpina]|uniref:MTOR-associated protein MEAK7 n=1 Tax=Mortierella alpina TaxID=64518 RepID=A0A9P6JCU3_MORAP|nr:hypothetical protein BGZ70_010372 [Mortierella alpina]
MGSQPSKQDTAIEACLADFPGQEREHLLGLFETLCKGPGNERSSSHDDHSIDPQHFNAYFGPLLPPTLLACFRVTMQMHSMIHQPNEDLASTAAGGGGGGGGSSNENISNSSNNSNNNAKKNKRRSVMTRSTSVDASSPISKYGWVMTIHRLSKTSIEEQAGLSFMLQTHDASLESFVGNVTRAAMVFWLAGEVASWKAIPEKDVEATTEFLLTRHLEADHAYDDDLEEEEEDHQDKEEDADAKVPEKSRETRTTGPKTKAARDWLQAAQKRDAQGHASSKELSRSAFLNWYQRTVEYQILFTILIRNLFLGSSTLPSMTTAAAGAGADLNSSSGTLSKRIKLPIELENKLCQRNFIAPRIKGGLDVAPRFSRLLSVADFFQLQYALPTPVIGNVLSANPPTSSSTHGSKQGPGGAAGSSSGEGSHSNDSVRPTPPLRLLFSSRTSGASFSTLLQKITYQGPTLVVMKDEDGYIFGAYADQDWEQGPKFYGTDRSFLFTIRPQFRIYRPSKLNANYQYLDSGTKTLPNGMGFGGQLRYFGLWLASDFQTGQSAAEPLCSTFQSPRLSKQQNFKLDEVEDRDEEPKHSAMDAHPDAVALLEMANRKMYSKDVRAPENVYESD